MVINMNKRLPKTYIDNIPEKNKCKSCIGCEDLSNPKCGIIKSIRYSSGAMYIIKVPDKDCIAYNKQDKAVNVYGSGIC